MDFTSFKSIYGNHLFKKTDAKKLNSPRSTPTEALTGGIQGRDPTGQSRDTPAELRSAGFRRRRGLRPRGEHQRAPCSEAHP